MDFAPVSGTLPVRIPEPVPPPILAAQDPLTPHERAELARRVLAGLRNLDDGEKGLATVATPC